MPGTRVRTRQPATLTVMWFHRASWSLWTAVANSFQRNLWADRMVTNAVAVAVALHGVQCCNRTRMHSNRRIHLESHDAVLSVLVHVAV